VAGPGQRYDLSSAMPAKRGFLIALIGGGDALFALAIVFLWLYPGRDPAARSVDTTLDVVFVAAIAFLTAFGVGMSRITSKNELVIDDLGVRIERRGKVVLSIPWTGGRTRITLGDGRIREEDRAVLNDRPGTVPPPLLSTPPNAAWINSPGSFLGFAGLTDTAYRVILKEAELRGLPVRSSVSYRYVGPPSHKWYYVEMVIG